MKPKLNCVLFLALVTMPASLFAEDVISIQELEGMKARWPQMLGKEIRVEGRYSFVARETMKFIGTDLVFVIDNDTARPKKDTRTVQVTGRIIRINGKSAFRVARLKSMPDDKEYAEQQMRLLLPGNIKEAHELGEWAAKRGKFYEDEELNALSTDIHLQAIKIERSTIKPDDGTGLLTLAAKVAQYNLPDKLRREIVHEGLRRQWDELKTDEKANMEAFVKTLNQSLPASAFPLKSEQKTLRDSYAKNPVIAYRTEEAKNRSVMDRLFHYEVVDQWLSDKEQKDDRNADELAKLAAKYIPEKKDVIKDYENRSVKYLREGIKTATRQQALDLARIYRDRNEPEEAKKSLREWLDARTQRIKPDNLNDVFSISDDYVNLVKDPSAAAKLLQQAEKRNPTVTELGEKLEKLGYTKVDGNWFTKKEANKIPQDPILDAMKRGDVTKGMTREQVFKTLGNPTSSSRIVAKSGLTEVWTYADARIVIRFEKKNDRFKATVDAISALRN